MSFTYDFAFLLGGDGGSSENEAMITRYQDQLLKLLPPGPAFNRRTNSNIGNWLSAFSVELARVHGRVDDHYAEMYPGTATERLDEWEELCSLPDPCHLATTIADRRDAVLSRFVEEHGQGEGDLQDIATSLGYAITIELWDTFRTGVHTIGHMPIYSVPWYYALNVNYTPGATDSVLECRIRSHLHAHVVTHFNLTTGDLGWAADYFVSHPRI